MFRNHNTAIKMNTFKIPKLIDNKKATKSKSEKHAQSPDNELLNMNDSVFFNLDLPNSEQIKVLKEPQFNIHLPEASRQTSTSVLLSDSEISDLMNTCKRKTKPSNEITPKIIRLKTDMLDDEDFVFDLSKDRDWSRFERNDNSSQGEGQIEESFFSCNSSILCNREYNQRTDHRSTNELEKNVLDIGNTQLNQLFIEDDAIPCGQSSQKFCSDITQLQKNLLTQTVRYGANSQDGHDHTVIINSAAGTQYIRRQREMADINADNINDDFINDNFTQLINENLVQYLEEVEKDCDDCEKSINHCTKRGNDTMVQAFAEIENINWDSPVRLRDRSLNASTIVRRKINEINHKNLNESSKATFQMKPVTSSKFLDRGPFYGLPLTVKSLIKEYKGIDELYDWQKECLRLPAIAKRDNLIYTLPTSGGKTLVAEIILLREILCRQKHVIFILPYVSIVQEKVWSLSPFAVQLNFLVEEYAAGKGTCPPRQRRSKRSVFVCTIEKSLSLFDSLIDANRVNEIGLIVVDELHLLGETGRGAILEMVLTKAMFVKADIQIVGMSATLGNISEITEFLKADHFTRDFRPVELKEYIKCGNDILSIDYKAQVEDAFKQVRTIDYGYTPEMLKYDKDHLMGLVLEVIPKDSVLIFCQSKKTCQNVAQLLCNLFDKKLLEHRKEERLELMKIIRRDTGSPLCDVLRKTIPFGVAYHHSGLTLDERRHLEDAYRVGVLCIICCTSTLAAGVNLPAKRVIIRSPYVGNQFITLSKYKQMVGRAGRAGMGENGESFIICDGKDNLALGSLLQSSMDEAFSSLHNNNLRGISCFLLSAIWLNLAKNRVQLKNLIQHTLLAVQAKRLNVNLNVIVDDVIRYLFRKKAVQILNHKGIDKASMVECNVIQSQDSEPEKTQIMTNRGKSIVVNISNAKEFEVSKLGKASVRACIDLDQANALYKNLIKAQASLVLSNNLHLLYVCSPMDKIEGIKLNMSLYYSLYTKLTPDQLQTAKVLGITENVAIKMVSGKPFPSEIENSLKRLYVALMLQDLWNLKTVYDVAIKFDIDRGFVQQLLHLSATNASSILRFCEQLDEFWAMKELLTSFTKRLSYCCANELFPLMQLPSVKIGRAQQLYNAGFKNLETIAKSSSHELVQKIEYLSYRVAKQLIAAAQLYLLERVENLRAEVCEVMEHMNQIK